MINKKSKKFRDQNLDSKSPFQEPRQDPNDPDFPKIISRIQCSITTSFNNHRQNFVNFSN